MGLESFFHFDDLCMRREGRTVSRFRRVEDSGTHAVQVWTFRTCTEGDESLIVLGNT